MLININNRVFNSEEFTDFVKEHMTERQYLPEGELEVSEEAPEFFRFLILRCNHLNVIHDVHIDDFGGGPDIWFEWFAANSDGVYDWVMDRVLPGDMFIEVY